MIKPEALLHPTPAGLYCPAGDFYIDPTRPVDRAVITHGHSDHARAGHGAVLATPETLAIMTERYGADFAGATEAAPYGKPVHRDAVEVRDRPDGDRIVVVVVFRRSPSISVFNMCLSQSVVEG